MKKTVILGALAFLGVQMNAQMDDISVTLQPTGSYNWFDDNTAIDDGIMVGGRVGFGFGEALELRAIYEKSVDIKNTVDNLDFASEDFLENFSSRDVDIERIGGEFKANIPTRGSFVPYLTLGAGVQKLKVNIAEDNLPEVERKSEQIYANLGLGTQLRLSDRMFLNLEAKNTVFNMDPADVLFREGDNSGIGEWLDDREERMYNWSVLAGLQLYLGGRQPGAYSDLDRAYYQKFSGGMGGLKLILEPGGSYINFNNDSNLRDTYLLGGKFGFDLNQFIGIRGFYYQATQNEEISTKWDDMAMYGGDIIAKLNVARGIVPYLELGGGYLNIYDSYQGEDVLLPRQTSGYFAKGGVGLAVPISKNFEIFGSASLMYTSQRDNNDLENIISPNELTQHSVYSAGIRFQIGKSPDDTSDIVQRRIDARVNERTAVYQNRIDALEKELQDAYRANDTEKAVEIIEEKKELEDRKSAIEAEEKAKEEALVQKTMPTQTPAAPQVEEKTSTPKEEESRIKMTPEELEKLVEKVIQGVDQEEAQPTSTEDRIDRLERLLLEVNTSGNTGAISPVQQEIATDRIINKLDQLNSKIDNNTSNIQRLANAQGQGQDRTVVVTQGSGTQPQIISPVTTTPTNLQGNVLTTTTTDKDGNIEQQNKGVATGFFISEGMSLFGGYGFSSDEGAGLVGIRGHYSISTSPIKFMPDLYVAPGDDTGFGVNANALLAFDQISNNVIIQPYIGLGLGYNNIADYDKFGTNLIIGTSFNVLGGNLYADYTARNFIDIHQISVGYKFGF